MTCDECERIQDLAFDKNIDETADIYYYRVDKSNVAIIACKEHAKKMIDRLNEVKELRSEGNKPFKKSLEGKEA